MADGETLKEIESEEPEETPGYKAPAKKTLEEIQKQDEDDESLVRYKQTLLAGVDAGAGPYLFYGVIYLLLKLHTLS